MAHTSPKRKLLLIGYLVIVHALALCFILEKIRDSATRNAATGTVHTSDSAAITTDSGFGSRNAITATQPQQATAQQYGNAEADTGKLMIPVVGIKRGDLQDTYTQARSGGRVHDAIDIMAPGGTPVIAAADGEIAKFFDSKLGGTTIYQWSTDRKRVYYYAHLQRRADGIAEKMFVKRGTVIGFVGDTGNAGTGNFHLHFSIIIPNSPDRHWEGTNINPYPILKEGIEAPATQHVDG